MKKQYLIPILIVLIALSLGSCSKYNKLLKSTDYEEKYKAAVKYYEKRDYHRAYPLLEELLTIYRGTAKGEVVYFYYARTNFELEDYILAAYHFKNFYRTYPNSANAEEALYMNAYCYFLTSPTFSLDQSNTHQAIAEFQIFANLFPASPRIEECNNTIDKLREKLARKDFENAKLYYHVENYKSSAIAFRNFIKDHPSSKYREEAYYLMIKSWYLLAEESVEAKKAERYQQAIDNYLKFVDAFPNGRLLKDAKNIYEKSLRQKEKTNIKSS